MIDLHGLTDEVQLTQYTVLQMVSHYFTDQQVEVSHLDQLQ